jgi:hypothetical protein
MERYREVGRDKIEIEGGREGEREREGYRGIER